MEYWGRKNFWVFLTLLHHFTIPLFQNDLLKFWSFGIPLAFACLREAASAKAGILTFEIYDFLLSNRSVTGPSLTR